MYQSGKYQLSDEKPASERQLALLAEWVDVFCNKANLRHLQSIAKIEADGGYRTDRGLEYYRASETELEAYRCIVAGLVELPLTQADAGRLIDALKTPKPMSTVMAIARKYC